MTLDVYLGCTTTIQQQQQFPKGCVIQKSKQKDTKVVPFEKMSEKYPYALRLV